MKSYKLKFATNANDNFKYHILTSSFSLNFDNLFFDIDNDSLLLHTAITLIKRFNGDIHKTPEGYTVIIPVKYLTDIETLTD